MMTRDPHYTPFGGNRPPQPLPRLDLLERCWRLRIVPTGRELVCGIFETDAGLEVRCGYRDDLIHSRLCVDLQHARTVADGMKRRLIEDVGSIEELPLNEGGIA